MSSYDFNQIRNRFRIRKDAELFAESMAKSAAAKSSGGLQAQLAPLLLKDPAHSSSIGQHPDLLDLEHGSHRYRYAVSMFVDMKDSTRLSAFLKPHETKMLKDQLLITAIECVHTCGGFVHRIMGDAVLAFFGHDALRPEQACYDALNAGSLLLSAMKELVNPTLEAQGIDRVAVRVGVDYGPKDDVMWSHFGVLSTAEISPESFYVNIAAKLQSAAPSNGMMIGDSLRTFLDLPAWLCGVKTKKKDGVETPVPSFKFQHKYDQREYKKWLFNWEERINQLRLPSPFGQRRSAFGLQAHVLSGENGLVQYGLPSGALVLQKGTWLRFTLNRILGERATLYYTVENTGSQATEAGDPGHETEEELPAGTFRHSTERHTAYRGFHRMSVRLATSNRVFGPERYYVCIA